MSPAKEYSEKERRAIRALGQKIEQARLAKRMNIREAADLTHTARGHMTESTWRRIERGYGYVGPEHVVYKPQPYTIAAMAEVVGLDAGELCKMVGLTPPPKRQTNGTDPELEDIRRQAQGLLKEIDRYMRRSRRVAP